MSRLFNRLLTESVTGPDGQRWTKQQQAEAFSGLPVVDVQAVSRWFYETRGVDTSPVPMTSWRLRPPWTSFGLEYDDTAIWVGAASRGDGAHAVVFDGFAYSRVAGFASTFMSTHVIDDYGAQTEPEETVLSLWMLKAQEAGMKVTGAIADTLRIACCALTFLNCNNVAVRPQGATKLDRVFEKRHQVKGVRYHVLDIQPLRTMFREGAAAGDTIGVAQSLHLCRGHFKSYTGKPLFGRHRGMFWWQPHMRGSEAVGTVTKDYRIVLPTGSARAGKDPDDDTG